MTRKIVSTIFFIGFLMMLIAWLLVMGHFQAGKVLHIYAIVFFLLGSILNLFLPLGYRKSSKYHWLPNANTAISMGLISFFLGLLFKVYHVSGASLLLIAGIIVIGIMITVFFVTYVTKKTIADYEVIELPAEELDKYLGSYYNEKSGQRITVTRYETTLIAQATRQPAFGLKAIGHDSFVFVSDHTSLQMDFDVTGRKMVLKQHGRLYDYIKE